MACQHFNNHVPITCIIPFRVESQLLFYTTYILSNLLKNKKKDNVCLPNILFKPVKTSFAKLNKLYKPYYFMFRSYYVKYLSYLKLNLNRKN